ncbi:hypothetical protein EVJ58_g10666 [Rhodofomes roseus]|uniref:Restriction of telomere capping protein 4 n=1 Tax=Rhodofomes roseus TaxID=34475 RepID=A0A4Y9XLT5_9APHY|nr:hypothetical protein EVJ58_g10666 [Rhodofomes roseus]
MFSKADSTAQTIVVQLRGRPHKANEAATTNRIPRMYCHAHKMQGFEGPSVPIERWRTGFANAPSAPGIQPAAPVQRTAVGVPLTAGMRTDPTKQGRQLARPIGPLWETQFNHKNAEVQQTKTTKARREELSIREKKTVLFVVFYENDAGPDNEPVEIKEHVETWPQVQFADMQLLVKAFRLSGESFIMHYEPKQSSWVLGRLDTIITVDPSRNGTRILLRLPKDLHTVWPSSRRLEDELQKQSRKRGALTELVSPVKKTIRSDTGLVASRVVTQPSPTNPVDDLPDQLRALPAPSDVTMHQAEPVYAMVQHNEPSDVPSAGKGGIRRRWPTDFYVYEVGDGITDMRRRMLAQSSSSAKGKGLTKAEAFRDVFGLDIVRSTYVRVVNMWDALPQETRRRYIAYGRDPKARWPTFWGKYKDIIANTPNEPEDGALQDKSHGTQAFTSADEELDSLQTQDVLSASNVQERQSSSGPSEHVQVPMSPTPSPIIPVSVRWPSPLAGEPPLPAVPEIDFSAVEALPALAFAPELDPNVPKCEFCDEIIPADFVESPMLARMRQELEACSELDPMAWNPRHRRTAHWEVHQAYCEQHDFEWRLLPQAREAGWPTVVDFGNLRRRILRMLPELCAIIKKPRMSEFFARVETLYTPHPGKRTLALGTQLAMYDLAAQSVGYYGAKGYEMILFMLLHLFDNVTFNCGQTKPVPFRETLEHVLIPEVAVRLIQDDLSTSRMQALEILRDSSPYGAIAHPTEANDPDVDTMVDAATALVRKNMVRHEEYIQSGSSMDFEAWVRTVTMDVDERQSEIERGPTVKHEPRNDLDQLLSIKAEEDDTLLTTALKGEVVPTRHSLASFKETISEDGKTIFELID